MGYNIEWKDSHCIHIKYDGVLTLNEILSAYDLVSTNPKYASIKYQITDFLKVNELAMPEKDIKLLSNFHVIPSLINPNRKLAIVSNKSKIQKKVLQYIKLMKGNDWKIKLFDNLEEASDWCRQN